MSLFLHQFIKPEGELGLWRITESEEWFRDRLLLYPAELRQLSTIKGRKRLEWLAVRQLVHDMSGREKRGAFVKDAYGKPHLEGADWQISISHSHQLAAAIAAPITVGIDIQFLVAKIGRLAHKYMRPDELNSLRARTEIEHLHVYWGAKEALYKAYGRRELDFKTHIHVHPFEYDLTNGTCLGQVSKDGWKRAYQICYRLVEREYMLVYVLEIPA